MGGIPNHHNGRVTSDGRLKEKGIMQGTPARELALHTGDKVAVQLEAEQSLYWNGIIDHLGPDGRPWFTPDNPRIAPVYLSWQRVVVLQTAAERRRRQS